MPQAALIESARLKGTYLHERYLQASRRRGDKKAIIAVAHEILVAAYRILAPGQLYIDPPGPEHLRNLNAEHMKRRAVAQLLRRAIGAETGDRVHWALNPDLPGTLPLVPSWLLARSMSDVLESLRRQG